MTYGVCGFPNMLSTEVTYYPTEEGKKPGAGFPLQAKSSDF